MPVPIPPRRTVVHSFSFYPTPLALAASSFPDVTINLDQSLSSSKKNRKSLTWVLVALTVCPTSILTHIESRPNLELASGICECYGYLSSKVE